MTLEMNITLGPPTVSPTPALAPPRQSVLSERQVLDTVLVQPRLTFGVGWNSRQGQCAGMALL
jgi:hypothetical protein